MADIKERPIIFSTDNVRAILEDRKVQTRRVIKPQPHIHTVATGITHCRWQIKPSETLLMASYPNLKAVTDELLKHCPYGQVGDRLWLRETFLWDRHAEHCIYLNSPDPIYENDNRTKEELLRDKALEKISAIFMPRWASRINLEITGVRVERLQEITPDDCTKEGIPDFYDVPKHPFITGVVINRVEHFKSLWDSLNAKRGFGWSENPFVWCISFKRME